MTGIMTPLSQTHDFKFQALDLVAQSVRSHMDTSHQYCCDRSFLPAPEIFRNCTATVEVSTSDPPFTQFLRPRRNIQISENYNARNCHMNYRTPSRYKHTINRRWHLSHESPLSSSKGCKQTTTFQSRNGKCFYFTA